MMQILLENAVAPIPALNNIKTVATQLATQYKKPLLFDDYLALLKDAATLYDSRSSAFGGTATRSRKVYQANRDNILDVADFETANSFDIDTPISTIQAYKAQYNPAARLHGDVWHQLTDEERNDWDKFSDQTKALILKSSGIRNSDRNRDRRDGPPSARPSSSSRPPYRRPTRSAHETVREILQVYKAALATEQDSEDETEEVFEDSREAESDTSDNEEDTANKLVSFLTEGKFDNVPAGNIAKLMSSSRGKKPTSAVKKSTTRQAKMHMVTYTVSNSSRVKSTKALVDRGSNGIVSGADTRIIDKSISGSTVHIQGHDNHQVNNIPIVTAGGVIQTQHGPVIAILHNSAHIGKGHTILSAIQLEHFGCNVDEKSIRFGGKQSIQTADGYVIPIDIRNGLSYINLRPFTDKEWDTLPHVIMTSANDWDPGEYDHNLGEEDTWYDTIEKINEDIANNVTDATGNYMFREAEQHSIRRFVAVNKRVITTEGDMLEELKFLDADSGKSIKKTNTGDGGKSTEALPSARDVKKDPVNYDKFVSNFLHVPMDIIKKTFENTTQFARMPMSD